MKLLLVAVGPVQGFIRSSRKSQDLWAGSDLMSSLAKAAAAELKAAGARLVFPPAELIRAENRPIANKLLVEVPDDKDAGELASAASRAVRAALSDRLNDARERLDTFGVQLVEHLARRQAESFLELTWASHESSGSDYPVARRLLEEALDGRKRLRDFIPYRGEAGRLKSSFDGIFETVLDPAAAKRLVQHFGEAFVSPGEELDAMGIVRRFYRDDEDVSRRWKSSSQVAVMPYVTQARKCATRAPLVAQVEGVAADVDRVAQRLGLPRRSMDTDLGELLLQPAPARRRALGRHLPGVVNPGPTLPEPLNTALQGLEVQIQELLAAKKGEGAPSPYYAVLSADGDKIGSFLAGLPTPDEHRRAASWLASFAGCVIDELGGQADVSVIFAGGDDVLGFVSLDSAVSVVKKLDALFRREVADKAGAPLSLSVGLALVHVRDSFQDAIRLAKKAERDAKDEGGGRLALALSKRAGRDTRLVLPLGQVHAGRIEETVRLLRGRDIPTGLAYELEALAEQIQDAHEDLRGAEIRRVFGRKRADRGERPIDEAALDWLVSWVSRKTEADGRPTFVDQARELVSLLLIGAHFARYIQPSTFAPTATEGAT